MRISNVEELLNYCDNGIIVCSKNFKTTLQNKIANQTKLINIKILTINEYYQMFGYIVNPNCLYEIYQEVSLNYLLAKEIYNNLHYDLTNIVIPTKDILKMDNLQQTKYFQNKFLQNGLIKNNINKNLNSHPIYAINTKLDNLQMEYQIIDFVIKDNDNIKLTVNEYQNIQEEINVVCNKISNILQTENIQNIKVYLPASYHNLFKIIAKFYNIPLKIAEKIKIISLQNIRQFNNDLQTMSLKKSLQKLENSKTNPQIITKIIQKINSYAEYINQEQIDNNFIIFLQQEIAEITYSQIKQINVIEIADIQQFEYNNNNYNFFLGFNNLDFINFKQDHDFLNDKNKEKIKLNTSIETNNNLKKEIKNIINFLKTQPKEQTYISFAKSVNNKIVEINNSLEINNFIIIKGNEYQDFQRNSYAYDQFRYKQEAETYSKYKVKSPSYEILSKNVEYPQQYNNQMEKLELDKTLLKNELALSATSLDSFFKCQYKFYLEKILRLRIPKKNQNTIDIGNYLHMMLEKLINPIEKPELENASFEKIAEKINEYQEIVLKEYQESNYQAELFQNLSTNQRKIAIFKMNKYLKEIIPIIYSQINSEKFIIKSVEEEIEMNFENYKLVGKIDQVLEDDNNNYIVIDYKTGESSLNLEDELIEEGINLQNLIYFVLLKNKYQNVNFGGTYRYHIKPHMRKSKLEEQESLREGYTNKKIDVISKINIENYQNLKYKNDGEFAKLSKVLDDEEFSRKIEIVEKKIKEVIKHIEEEDIYLINPKKKDNPQIDSCQYCAYQEICFKNKNNIEKEKINGSKK